MTKTKKHLIPNFKTHAIDHIGIAVKKIGLAKTPYELLGLKVSSSEFVSEQKVNVAFISIGDTRLELLEATSEDSTIAKFIKKRGEGFHHICFLVDDLEGISETLKTNGIKLIYESSKSGAGHSKINFIHPDSTNGLLVELIQK